MRFRNGSPLMSKRGDAAPTGWKPTMQTPARTDIPDDDASLVEVAGGACMDVAIRRGVVQPIRQVPSLSSGVTLLVYDADVPGVVGLEY